jgi:hypothetical protein
MNGEILESLDAINENYEEKERFKKYYEIIDKYEIPFTVWLTYSQIDRQFIYKWLDRWSEIPEKVIESIAKRNDYYFFYDILAKKGYLFYFLQDILKLRELYKDDIDIIIGFINLKDYKSGLEEFLNLTYEEYKYQKDSTWVYKRSTPPLKQLGFIKNLIFSLIQIYRRTKHDFVFEWIILFYDISVFNCTNYNKYISCKDNISFIYMLANIHNYLLYNFLEDCCFNFNLFRIQTRYGAVDLIQEMIAMYTKSYIQIGCESVLQLFANIFNNHYNYLNILQRVSILECINYNILFFNEDNVFIRFDNLDINLLQQVYIDCDKLDDDISYKLIIISFILSVSKKKGIFIKNKKFLYYFIQDLFKLLDDFKPYCDIYESILTSDSNVSDYVSVCHRYILQITEIFEHLSNLIVIENDNLESILYSSELKKKITDSCGLHIKNLNYMFTKYSKIQETVSEFNIGDYISKLFDTILFYRDCKDFDKIIDNCKTHLDKSDVLELNLEMKRFINKAKVIEHPDDIELDAITMEHLYEPVTLPSSKMIVNKDTIKIHLYEHDFDPFTRVKFTKEEIDYFMS